MSKLKSPLAQEVPSITMNDGHDGNELQKSDSESSVDSTSSKDDGEDTGKSEAMLRNLEDNVFACILDGDSDRFKKLAKSCKSSTLLQVILTFSHNNTPPKDEHAALNKSMSHVITDQLQSDANSEKLAAVNVKSRRISMLSSRPLSMSLISTTQGGNLPLPANGSRMQSSALQFGIQQNPPSPQPQHFTFDPDIQDEAAQLLGSSITPLSFVHIAILLGEEVLSVELLHFVFKHTTRKGQKLLLMEFLNRVWGDGNSALHLASFQGMSDVVDELLKCGANPHKRNEKGYKPVDCADDDSTRKLFRVAIETMRLSGNESLLKRQGSIMTRTGAHPKVEKKESAPELSVGQTASSVAVAIQPSAPKSQLEKIKELSSDKLKSQSSPDIIVEKLSQVTAVNSVQDGNVGTTDERPHKKRKTIGWNQNALLFDYCKTGEGDQLRLLFQTYKVSVTDAPSQSDGTAFSVADQCIHINQANGQGMTALHLACGYGHEDVCDLLLQHGAKPNARDKEGFTPLHALVSEIPLLQKPKDQKDGSNSPVKKLDKRPLFIKLLKKWVALPEVDLAVYTDDGDSILELVREDADGQMDSEVLKTIEQALRARNIELDSLMQTDSELGSPDALNGSDINAVELSQLSLDTSKSEQRSVQDSKPKIMSQQSLNTLQPKTALIYPKPSIPIVVASKPNLTQIAYVGNNAVDAGKPAVSAAKNYDVVSVPLVASNVAETVPRSVSETSATNNSNTTISNPVIGSPQVRKISQTAPIKGPGRFTKKPSYS